MHLNVQDLSTIVIKSILYRQHLQSATITAWSIKCIQAKKKSASLYKINLFDHIPSAWILETTAH
ncbi:hypothetical protein WH47_06976 [Habropoda laboriosa]|uniref:Uncharacterized protein n=1 Tax=Habropoda laboriosa TaxID=597456 RepID=A0A0L7RHK1_9HYME|nr:hypothetical protein WH47_06976 [Habropoda laboriosa]